MTTAVLRQGVVAAVLPGTRVAAVRDRVQGTTTSTLVGWLLLSQRVRSQTFAIQNIVRTG